jgi:hypothetical protein
MIGKSFGFGFGKLLLQHARNMPRTDPGVQRIQLQFSPEDLSELRGVYTTEECNAEIAVCGRWIAGGAHYKFLPWKVRRCPGLGAESQRGCQSIVTPG